MFTVDAEMVRDLGEEGRRGVEDKGDDDDDDDDGGGGGVK